MKCQFLIPDEALLYRSLEAKESLREALAERWRIIKWLRGRLSLLWRPRFGIRLVGGDLHRADFTLTRSKSSQFQSGFAESVRIVFYFQRWQLADLVDSLIRNRQRIVGQPWLLLRYAIVLLRALRWRTPSGVLIDPHLVTIGSLALAAMLVWRFWPHRRRQLSSERAM